MNKNVDKSTSQGSESDRTKSEQCKIFVIQRGSDTKFWAQQIADELLNRGYYTTDPSETDVFIIIIGKEFKKALTKDLKNFLITLLKLDKFVVPVCVNGARMPDKVPASLSELTKKQAVEITSGDNIYELIIRIVDTFVLSKVPAENTIHPSAWNIKNIYKSNLPAEEPYIFICYRRDDSEYNTNELSRALVKRIGGHRIFIDLGSQKPGINYINPDLSFLVRQV